MRYDFNTLQINQVIAVIGFLILSRLVFYFRRQKATEEKSEIPSYLTIGNISEFKMTDEERDLIKRLSLSITGGRYPIHKSWLITKIQRLFGGGIGPPSYWRFPKDEELFLNLVDRLTQMIEN